MSVNLVKVSSDDELVEYKLMSEDKSIITSYDVELNNETALISYDTKEKYRRQGYASLGLNLLKEELFKNNQILLLELIHLSGDYSRKVAENAGFFSQRGMEYWVAIHPYAEDICKIKLQSLDSSSKEYKKYTRLLEKMENLRKREEHAKEELASKLEYLRDIESQTDDESYREHLNTEINHIAKILGDTSEKNNSGTVK